jgi:hypothetical protein
LSPITSVLLPLALLAADPAPAGVEQGLAASMTGVAYATPFRSTGHWTVDLGYSRALGERGLLSHLRATVGGRVAFDASDLDLPLEAYVGLALRAGLGPWQPELGPELGVTGLNQLGAYTNGFPAQSLMDSEKERTGPLFGAVRAAPLRFQLGWVRLSALELGVGTALSQPGASARFELRAISVEVSL